MRGSPICVLFQYIKTLWYLLSNNFSAVIETSIQHERALQLKFKKEVLDPYVKEQKRLNDQDIVDKAKAWTKLQKQKAAKKREINKVHQQELIDQ